MYIQSCMHKLLPASLGKHVWVSHRWFRFVVCEFLLPTWSVRVVFKVKTKQAQTITHCSYQAAALQHSHKTSWDGALRAKKIHPNGCRAGLYTRVGTQRSSLASLPGFASYFYCFMSQDMSSTCTWCLTGCKGKLNTMFNLKPQYFACSSEKKHDKKGSKFLFYCLYFRWFHLDGENCCMHCY